MPYIDEEILEAKRKQEHQKYTTLETGMYAGDELITFAQIEIPDTKISLFLPEQFVLMPEEVKRVKYPSQDAPDYIFTSLDSTVNICINIMPILLKEKEKLIKKRIESFRLTDELIKRCTIINKKSSSYLIPKEIIVKPPKLIDNYPNSMSNFFM